MWLCKFHHGRGRTALPISWTERVTNQGEDPLWSRGWTSKERYEHETGAPSLQGHGLWQHLEVLDLADHRGYVLTNDAMPTTYDTRSQGWVFALCLHTLSTSQLQRVAAITGLPPGQQTKARALYYGMRVLPSTPTSPSSWWYNWWQFGTLGLAPNAITTTRTLMPCTPLKTRRKSLLFMSAPKLEVQTSPG